MKILHKKAHHFLCKMQNSSCIFFIFVGYFYQKKDRFRGLLRIYSTDDAADDAAVLTLILSSKRGLNRYFLHEIHPTLKMPLQ